MSKDLIKQQLRNYLNSLKLANYNMRVKNYESAVKNLQESGQYLMSAESCINFAEKQKLKSQN